MGSRLPYRLAPVPLGHGGYGVVWRAEHRETGEVVALKKAIPGGQGLHRLRREIAVQQQMSHPHVMPILDASPTGSWFTMPLATETLISHRRLAPLSDLTLAVVLHSVARGLQYAHNRGHIHRDVTPGNILRISDAEHGDRWVVADWGLVQRPDGQASLPLTLTGQVLGTRAFGPPELMTAPHGVGPEVDVYYMGAVTAWALTGEEPSHHHMPMPENDRWRAFVQRTTRRDPERRPRSMMDVLAELHEMREEFQAGHDWQAINQGVLFPEHPCGACGAEVEGMRCGNCGSYYATYN